MDVFGECLLLCCYMRVGIGVYFVVDLVEVGFYVFVWCWYFVYGGGEFCWVDVVVE